MWFIVSEASYNGFYWTFFQINIAGYMHFWGLTVDTVTTIQLILAIGLSVDYSAHIGHGFMASRRGNRAGKFCLCSSCANPTKWSNTLKQFELFECV